MLAGYLAYEGASFLHDKYGSWSGLNTQSDARRRYNGLSGMIDGYAPPARHVANLRTLGLTDDQVSDNANPARTSGAINVREGGKWGEVTGTVTGTAELHQNLTITLQPSAYLESIVQRAEAASAINLSGKLGTSMQGPGDNSVKPIAPTGVQQ